MINNMIAYLTTCGMHPFLGPGTRYISLFGCIMALACLGYYFNKKDEPGNNGNSHC